MISDQDRKSLIIYRIQQASDTIELAEFLISSGKLIVAVNRIYYGMYYSLTALALKHKFETSKHAQLWVGLIKNLLLQVRLIKTLVKY